MAETEVKLIILFAVFANLAVFIVAQSKTSDDFHVKSENCFRQLAVPQRYKTSFESFQYENNEIVHKYLHCVATALDIWEDRNGFNVEKIYQQYRARANEEVVLPVITNCNQSAESSNKDLWCYRAFLCILNSDVGTWFKEDVRRSRTRNLPNGHH